MKMIRMAAIRFSYGGFTAKFNPEKYRKGMEEACDRMEAISHFEEPDRVPVCIALTPIFYSHLFNVPFKDFYGKLSAQIYVQVKALEWSYAVLQDDRCYLTRMRANKGATQEGIVFDCEIRWPDERRPWQIPWIVPKIKTLEDIDDLTVPDPATHKGIQAVYQEYEEMKRMVGGQLPVGGGLQIHPPLSAAGSLMGTTRLYTFLYKYPKEMHKFLKKLLRAFFALQDYYNRYFGVKTESIGLCDDHGGFLSEAMYRKFVLPYNKAIYERYGRKERRLHMDSSVDHIAHILVDELKIESMDLGFPTDISKVKAVFDGKVVFNGNVNQNLLVEGVPCEKINEAVDYCIRNGAPGGGYFLDMGGGTDVGIDVRRLLYLVKYAKRAGRYQRLKP